MEFTLISQDNENLSIIERVLKNRGIDNAYHYLNTTDDDIINPLELDNMLEGAKMLMRHIKSNSKVYV